MADEDYGVTESEEGVIPTVGGGDYTPPETMPVEELLRPRRTATVTSDYEPPETMSLDDLLGGAGTASRPGAYARRFSEGVIPGLAAVAGGMWTGGKTGLMAGSKFGPWGATIGGIGGMLVGGALAGYGAHQAQDVALGAAGLREGEGWFSDRQRATDYALYPHTSFLGEMTPALLTMRPGKTLDLAARGIGAGVGGLAGAGMEYIQKGEIDPINVAMGAAAGAALPHVNRPTYRALGAMGMPRNKYYMPQDIRREIYPFSEAPAPLPELPPKMLTDMRPKWGTPEITDTGAGYWQNPEKLAQQIQHVDTQLADPRVDPAARPYWEGWRQKLVERRDALGAGMGDVEINASMGPGTPLNKGDASKSNAVASPAAGVAFAHQPMRPPAGMEVGGAGPNVAGGPENWLKDSVRPGQGPITAPSTPVTNGMFPGDISFATRHWAGAARRPRAPEPAPAPQPAAPRPAPMAVPVGLPPQQPVRTSVPNRRTMAPEAQAPAQQRPVTATATQGNARDLANQRIQEAGGNPVEALKRLASEPDATSNPVKFDTLLMLNEAVKASAPKAPPVGATPVAPAVTAAPVVPALRKAPAASAKVAPASAPTPVRGSEGQSRVPIIRQMQAAGQTDEQIAAALKMKPETVRVLSGRPKLKSAEEVLAARKQPTAEELRAEVARIQTAGEQPAPAPGTTQQPAAQSPIKDVLQWSSDGKKVIRRAPYSLDTVAKWRKQAPDNTISFEVTSEKPFGPKTIKKATQAAIEGRPPTKPEIAREPAEIKPVVEHPRAPKPAETPAPEAPKFVPKDNTVPLPEIPSVSDPTANMSPKMQERLARAHDIDTKNDPTWRDKLRTLLTATRGSIDIGPAWTPRERRARGGRLAKIKEVLDKFWKDERGALDIGPHQPGKIYRDDMDEVGARFFVNSPGFFKEPVKVIADAFYSAARGYARWAVKAIDELFNKFPGLREQEPKLPQARALLAEEAQGEPPPSSIAAETKIPGPKTPIERTTAPEETPLPELPEHLVMQQKTPRGVLLREAPSDPELAIRWSEQFPDSPITHRRGQQPREPLAEPEPLDLTAPVTRAAETTGTPSGVDTPTGRRTQPETIVTDTGEVRPPKVWTDTDIEAELAGRAAAKPGETNHLASYRPEETKQVAEYIGTLDADKQPEALQLWATTPKEQFYPAVEKLLGEIRTERARKIKRGEIYELSNGAIAGNKSEYDHRQGILDANQSAYDNNPFKDGETNQQTIARAAKMVREADEEIGLLVDKLKKDQLSKTPPGPINHLTGTYNPSTGERRPAGTVMLNAARQLGKYKKPKAEHVEKFRESELYRDDGGLESKQRAIDADIESGKFVRQGTAEEGGIDLGNLPDIPRSADRIMHVPRGVDRKHTDLVEWLNGLDNYKYNMIKNRYGETFDIDVQETSSPITLRKDLDTLLTKAQEENNKYAFDAVPAEDAPISKRVTSIGPPLRAKHGTARELIPGTPEFKRARAEHDIGEIIRKTEAEALKDSIDATTDKNVKANVGWLQRAENFFGAATWTRSPRTNLEEIKRLIKAQEGSLDVSKIFDWIDKAQKKFRPGREPMVPTGSTRLYKGEDGKWSDLTRAEIIASESTPTRYVDVPTSVIEQYRDGNPGVTGKAATRLEKKWDEKIALKESAPDARQAQLEPGQMGLVDHLRRLWADESGALDITSLPAWVPNIRNKIRDYFTPDADPHILEYGKQLGEDWVKARTRMARPVRDLFYALRKAKYDDGTLPTEHAFGQMYRAWENRTEHTLPERDQKYIKDHLNPLMEKALKTYNELREIMVRNEFDGYKDMPEIDDSAIGPRFMYRRSKKAYEQEGDYDPITNRNSMTLWNQSIEPREWFTVQAPNGQRTLFHVNDADVMTTYKNGIAGPHIKAGEFDPRQVGHEIPGMGKITHATIDEIMAHGNAKGGKKPAFYDNPMMVAADAFVGMTRSLERAKFLDGLINDPKFEGYRTFSKTEAEKKWGEGNVKQPMMPYLQKRNTWVPKQLAWALDDMVKMGFNYNGNKFMEGLARFNQAALKPFYFVGPEVHVMNELDKLIVGSGWRLPHTMKQFGKALKSVRLQDDLQTEIMEAGGNPMFMHSMVSRAMPNIARTLGANFIEQPWRWDPIRKVTGYDIKPGWEHVYQESNKMMWWQSDVLYTAMYLDKKNQLAGKLKGQFDELDKLRKIEKPTAEQVTRKTELEKWNAEIAKKAVHESEKVIDSYVVPTTFGKTIGLEGTDAGRAFQQFLTDPATANFGRFSYGLYKTLANIAKNMVGKNENLTPAQSAMLGMSQAGLLVAMGTLVYPYLSKAYQQLPWAKPESEVEKRGITSVASIPFELAHKGAKDGWSKLARRFWSPAASISAPLSLYENRDPIGRPLFETAGGWDKLPGQAAEFALSTMVSPASQVSRAYQQEGPEFALTRFIESNFGLKTPSDAQIRYEARRPKEEQRQAKSRERHARGVLESGGNTLSSSLRRMIRGYEEGGLVEPESEEEKKGHSEAYDEPEPYRDGNEGVVPTASASASVPAPRYYTDPKPVRGFASALEEDKDVVYPTSAESKKKSTTKSSMDTVAKKAGALGKMWEKLGNEFYRDMEKSAFSGPAPAFAPAYATRGVIPTSSRRRRRQQ